MTFYDEGETTGICRNNHVCNLEITEPYESLSQVIQLGSSMREKRKINQGSVHRVNVHLQKAKNVLFSGRCSS